MGDFLLDLLAPLLQAVPLAAIIATAMIAAGFGCAAIIGRFEDA